MIIVTLARKPLREANVAANVLAHGVGAVNVDGCRVVAAAGDAPSSHSQSHEAAFDERKVYGKYAGGLATQQSAGQKLGRWPANLVLQHLADCREVGVKGVKSTSHHMGSPQTWLPHATTGRTESVVYGDYEHSGTGICHVRADGTETTAWDCEPGCPVADLDGQSGARPVSGSARGAKRAESCEGAGPTFTSELQRKGVGTLHDDAGGAARYFKQVGGRG